MSEFFKRIQAGQKTAGSIVGQEELAWYHNNFNTYNSLLDFKMRAQSSAMDDAQAVGVYQAGSVSWVNIALNRKMNDIANIDFFFVDKNGQKIPWDKVPEELRIAFENGYAGMSLNEMAAHAIGHEDLAGNILWLKSTDKSAYSQASGRVDQLIPITPGMFKICLNSKGTAVDAYEIKFKDGTAITVGPESVVHFKRNPMMNPFVGIGLISQGRSTVDYLSVSADYQKTFLEKDGTPDLVYIDKTMMHPDSAKQKAKQLREEYKAGKYSNSLMYAYGDVDIKSFSISSADMQFIENKQIGKNEIISLMESTPAVLGDEGAAGNKSVTSTASLNYFGVVNSRAWHLIEYINRQYLWTINGNQKKVYSLSFTPYPVGDVGSLKIAVETGLLKPSHAAKELGYEYNEDDAASNALYISRALQPLKTAFETQPPQASGLSDSIEDVKKNRFYGS